ncbi:MAG: hypothetical protein A3A33_04920 [Candidatus Yanofskybacteria bacterium RIFCSPLOWO2_01_FULL_49_25]|uniref:Uncharacterized protein n=1 Tax=Candidatus Yanofskybacteria bacterium RIFCSPLOWO2_01_FULL_49_25 TaxID=1802701 RepID=A0A1F8GQ56_9BACT|nr:MAG: hypothetical protein A3A33_04920 [Candidatus Yanofskybacteria bacterium RIFCSPLOWO2_01_FULL_49_25]
MELNDGFSILVVFYAMPMISHEFRQLELLVVLYQITLNLKNQGKNEKILGNELPKQTIEHEHKRFL